ncbi:PREDICTED: AF4/FMR2 family member 1 [Thamnophis sirtalis]|uniref:AF4/FMR2 family member 1 n=1 Tax=Thamnophis sirtalis TaxID=35019 RepID=A0A6I9YIX8_9SAUR|nr:PREDICTED: AF4/FMR2 family member 1 [Thamnophis sirtalis]
MFGNYEEMKELIVNQFYQNFIGIPTSVMPLFPPSKADRPLFSEKTGAPFQNHSHHRKHGGAHSSEVPSGGSSHPKIHSRVEPASQSAGLPSHQKPGPAKSCKTEGLQSGRCQPKSKKSTEKATAPETRPSLMELSPLLSALSSTVPPLSPLHSGQCVSSRSHSSKIEKRGQSSSPSQELPTSIRGNENEDTSTATVAVNAQLSNQTFPSSLSKTSAIQQKPTAYVRPMDGQDQAPDESPELKPLPEEYQEQSYGKITNLKTNVKTNLPKLKIPAEPIEQSYSNEAHCVEEILKEMTHSWPPPLTAIHTPSTAEPSKFPFPVKETQQPGSVIQKQCDAPLKTLSVSQQRTSLVCSAPQSQPESVAVAPSSSAESESTSDSDSSSDSESESSSSDSEGTDPPTRVSTPEPDPQTSNRCWQLNNWLIKVNQPVSPTESFLEDDHSRSSVQESKGQGKTASSSSGNGGKRECPMTDGHSKSGSRVSRSNQDVHLPTKRSYQKSPVVAEESLHQTVGSKQPRRSNKATVQEEPKRGLTVESEPPGLYGAKDQSSKDKPKVKTKGRPKSDDKKESKPTVPETTEKKKHKTLKTLFAHDEAKVEVAGSVLEPLPLSPLGESPRGVATSRTNASKVSVTVKEELQRDKYILPIRDKKLLSPLRDCPALPGLVVKIELALLSRIPQPPEKGLFPKKHELKDSHGMTKQGIDKRSTEAPSKTLKKRKQEDALRNDQKKIKLERETKSSSSLGHKDSSKTKMSKLSATETQRREMPLPMPPPLSPMQPAQKPPKTAQKRPKTENDACYQVPGPTVSTAKSKESHKESSSSKHRKLEGKPLENSKSDKGSADDVPNPFPVPSLPNGTSKPMKPQSKPHRQHPVEFHLKEAKRLKHKADAMTDKVGKAFKYLDAALSFIECGIAMESDPLSPKPAYTMFAETIDLIKFIMTLKSFADSSTTTQEKIFIVFCMRCQAILYMAMFRYKKDTAIKYSRTLNEHFKSSSRIAQAPSPCVGRGIGTPSPLSPIPSPAGSVSSQTGSSASSCGSSSLGSSVSVPHYIPTITSSFVNITSYILYAYDFWEQADLLARKNKKFFSKLNAAACFLSLNSSMIELVHYTRHGLQWLRLESNMP